MCILKEILSYTYVRIHTFLSTYNTQSQELHFTKISFPIFIIMRIYGLHAHAQRSYDMLTGSLLMGCLLTGSLLPGCWLAGCMLTGCMLTDQRFHEILHY